MSERNFQIQGVDHLNQPGWLWTDFPKSMGDVASFVLDTLSNQITARIDLTISNSQFPKGITSVGTKVYVVDQFHHMWVMDTLTNSLFTPFGVSGIVFGEISPSYDIYRAPWQGSPGKLFF